MWGWVPGLERQDLKDRQGTETSNGWQEVEEQATDKRENREGVMGRLRRLATDTLAGRQVKGQEGHQDRTEVGVRWGAEKQTEWKVEAGGVW